LTSIATLHGAASASPAETQLIALMPYAVRPYFENKKIMAEKFIKAMDENMHRLEDFIGARLKHSKNLEYCALRKLGPDVFSNDGRCKELLNKLIKDQEGDPEELGVGEQRSSRFKQISASSIC
jgi:hypothetical protein